MTMRSSSTEIANVLELPNKMEEPVDESLMSQILEACVRVGKQSLLSAKLKELHDGRIYISNAHTYGSLIKAYGYAGDIKSAWQCWQEMRARHIKPSTVATGCMAEAIVSQGDVDAGYDFVCKLLKERTKG